MLNLEVHVPFASCVPSVVSSLLLSTSNGQAFVRPLTKQSAKKGTSRLIVIVRRFNRPRTLTMVRELAADGKSVGSPQTSTEDEETEIETEAEEPEDEEEDDKSKSADSAQAKRALNALSRGSEGVRSSMGGAGDKDTLFFLNKKTAFEEKADRRKKVLTIMKVNPDDVTSLADAFDIDEETARRHLQENAGDLERTTISLCAL